MLLYHSSTGHLTKGCLSQVRDDKCLPQDGINSFGRMPLIIILVADYTSLVIERKQTEEP